MSTINAVNTTLSGQTGTGNFAGSTSATLTNPVIAHIYDLNSNQNLQLFPQANAVNYPVLYNSATGNNVILGASGTDTDIGIEILPKGAGFCAFYTTSSTGITVKTGAAYAHTTTFTFPTSSASRTITYPDSTFTVCDNSGYTSWTPNFTFTSNGDLSVVYSTRVGSYVKIGNAYVITFQLVCTPTYTTASGALNITGLPAASNSTTGNIALGSLYLSGTYSFPAGTTNVVTRVPAALALIDLVGTGTATASVNFTTSNFTSGQAVTIVGSVTYLI